MPKMQWNPIDPDLGNSALSRNNKDAHHFGSHRQNRDPHHYNRKWPDHIRVPKFYQAARICPLIP